MPFQELAGSYLYITKDLTSKMRIEGAVVISKVLPEMEVLTLCSGHEKECSK